MSGMISVVYFLFTVFFGFVTFILWARIALRYFRISSLHPMAHTIARFSDSVVRPFARFIPSSNSRAQRYDWPAFIVLVITLAIKFIFIGFLFLNGILPFGLLLSYITLDILTQPCSLLMYAVIARVIMSWVQPAWRNPMADILYAITEPMLALARRALPQWSSIDFSPLIVILCLKTITLIISALLPLHLI